MPHFVYEQRHEHDADPDGEHLEQRPLVAERKRLADAPAQQACGQPEPRRHPDADAEEFELEVGGGGLRFGEHLSLSYTPARR